MIGPSKALSASRIATDVWVKAAGLMTMPAARPRASWIQSMISYSRLLWWNSMSSPSSRAERAAVRLDVGQRLAPVDFRLALAEQVEVGPVQDDDDAAHGDRSLLNSGR